MNHEWAEKTNAADKYLLNELTDSERLDFEEHLFDCPVCSGLVRSDAIIVDNLKEVLLEPVPEKRSAFLNWMRPLVFVPTFAALALAVFTGYQNLVYIPELHAPRVLQTHVVDSVARGSGTSVRLDRHAPMFNLSFDVDSPQAYASYVCDFQNDRKETVLTVDAGKPEVAAFTLSLLLPTNKFPAGPYVAIVTAGVNRVEVRRLPFVIQN
ncbi:MAG TPA: zf-HC2 domain-containing protein [Bryobacteraceae bacterium]|nr:zf-HC2 domain-containing protein [Bryobacteraceae bacterium]